MLDVKRESYSEGTLARTWQERIRETPIAVPTVRRRRRRLSNAARTVYWIGGMWLLALVVTFAAVHVMQMAYQVDTLESQYSTLINQQQTMGVKISELTTPYALQQDASRLHVVLHAPMIARVQPQRFASQAKAPAGIIGQVFRAVHNALVGR